MIATRSESVARAARLAVIDALFRSGGGHYGGSLSVTDILAALYAERAERLRDDKIILSKGHAAIALYAVLREVGLLSADLDQFATFGSGLEGHPDMTVMPEAAFSTGSLGQGLAAGLGMALQLRHRRSSAHVWVILGDGECQEGQVWEAAMLASRYRVDNLHVILDANGAQECGWSHDATLEQAPLPSAVAKWAAFGWSATPLDGHDHDALKEWMKASRASSQPTAAIAHTEKGRGVRVADTGRLHCGQLTPDEYRAAIAGLRA